MPKKKIIKKKKITGPARIIIANWKANPPRIKDARKTFSTLKKANLSKIRDTIIICPPTTYMSDLISNYRGTKFSFGAQNISISENNEVTGEVTAEILKNLGVKYVIIGHSERRDLGENNSILAKKVKNAIDNNLKPILCVGEPHRDINGEYLRFIEKQLREILGGFSKKFLSNLIIAYEPVWAVGQNHKSIGADDLHQMNLFIRKVLVSIFDRKFGLNLPIVYGGSVDEENAKDLIENGEVNGLLIGRTSLNPHLFLKIIKEI